MNETRTPPPPTVMRRADRGLSIAGTRLTLYDLMDYFKRDWPPRLVQHWFDLTETQMREILEYLQTHREEVEAEYQQVVREAEELRRYYEEKHRERWSKMARLPPKPGTEALWAKLRAQKVKHEQEEQERVQREKQHDNLLGRL